VAKVGPMVSINKLIGWSPYWHVKRKREAQWSDAWWGTVALVGSSAHMNA
jgi:uncharacterized membrane protein